MALTKVSTPAIKDEAITLAKLLHGDSNSNGKFLRANNGADPTFETVNTDLVSDTSPQLGGNLDVNNKNILIGDSSGSTVNRLRIGAGPDLEIYHNGTDTAIQNYTGDLYINNTGGNADDIVIKAQDDIFLMPQNGEYGVSVLGDGAVELYYDNVKKLETTNTGIEVTGRITTDSLSIQDDGSNEPLLHLRADDANPWAFLISNDNYHSGTTQGLKWYVANNGNAYQHLQGNGTFEEFHLQQSNGGGTTNTGIKLNTSRAVELNYQGSKKFETTSDGSTQYGNLTIPDNDAKIILKDCNNYIQFLNTNKEFKFMNAWGAGEFTFYPGGSERVRIDGDGLKFNGDTGSGNAIDDYEEGLWSPSLSSGTAVWYNQQWYTKIGRMGTCYLYMYAFSDTSSSTHVKVGGLPFACNQARESGFVFKVQGSPSLGSGATGVSGRIGVTGNSTQISLYRDFASSYGASLNHQHLSNAHISLTFTYPAAV